MKRASAYYLSKPIFYIEIMQENNELDSYYLYSAFESYTRQLEAR